MNAVIKASVALAVLVEIVSVIWTVAGLHQMNPLLGFVYLVVVIVLNVGCIFWALKQTADQNGYGKQLLNVVVFGLIAGVLIFAFSMLHLTLLFPNYLDEEGTVLIEFVEGAGLPADATQARIDQIEARTPVRQSASGLIGTFLTSLIVGAIVAIFKRHKLAT
jgi:hypothetical protein